MKIKKSYIYFILSINIVIFIIYTKVYYGAITIDSIANNIVVCGNIFLNFCSKCINSILESLLTESNVKIILILSSIIFSIYKFSVKDIIISLLGDISNIETNLFKVAFARKEKIERLNEAEKNNIQNLESQNSENDDISEKINKSKIKINILSLMEKEPYLIEILDRFVEKKIKSVKIPMNIFKRNTSIEIVGQVFDYEINPGYIKITGIKNDIKDIIYDIYVKIKTC